MLGLGGSILLVIILLLAWFQKHSKEMEEIDRITKDNKSIDTEGHPQD